MTFKKLRVAAAFISVMGGLQACSSTTSNGGGGTDGGVYKPPTGEDGGGTTGADAGPPVGSACTTSTQCTTPAVCSNLGANGPLFPSPICIAACTPSATANEIAFCGPNTLPGAGLCEPQQTGGGACLPICYVSSGTVTGCLANDACQILTISSDPTNSAVNDLFGECQPGCTDSSQCPSGSKCDTFAAACLNTVTTPAQGVGASCNPSATTQTCACVGATGATTGFCSSACVTGGPACPQPGAASGDGGVNAGSSTAKPYVCSAQLGGYAALDAGVNVSTQPAGLLGLCFPSCDVNTDCVASLGTGATCTADPAGGTHLGICLPPQ